MLVASRCTVMVSPSPAPPAAAMTTDNSDTLMRAAAFDHVRQLCEVHDNLTAVELEPGFTFRGERVPLINPQRGIFKPQQMRYLLSIKTVYLRKVIHPRPTTTTGSFSRMAALN